MPEQTIVEVVEEELVDTGDNFICGICGLVPISEFLSHGHSQEEVVNARRES